MSEMRHGKSLFQVLVLLVLAAAVIVPAAAWSSPTDRSVVGVEWNASDPSPALRWIDVDGNSISQPDFNNHVIWGNVQRVLLDDNNVVTYGTNPRGDTLDLTGASGAVMVEIPKFYVKSENVGNYYRWWISPDPATGFELHPAFVQRSGTERDYIYIGAYEATLRVLSNGNLALGSRTGEQPWTGYVSNVRDGMFAIGFAGGSSQPAVGATIAGGTSGTSGKLVDLHVSSGSWGSGNAAGTLYLKQTSGSFTNGENLQVDGSTVAKAATATANAGMVMNINDFEAAGENIGSGWGEINLWSYSAIRLLYTVEHATWANQETTGLGIVSKSAGSGFAGEITGYDGIDSKLNEYGTWGDTSAGYSAVSYRGMENLWGNTWVWITGYTGTTSGINVVKRDGTGSLVTHPLVAGSYETSSAKILTTSGYWKTLAYEDLLQYHFIPSAIGGSENTYGTDYWYGGSLTGSTLLAGGFWYYGRAAGLGYLAAYCAASVSHRSGGARLEFIGDTAPIIEPGPYYVATYADLCKVGTGVDGWTLDAEYIQAADIQCPAGSNFVPIGSTVSPFSGTYEGGGYVISGLSMEYTSYDYSGVGMFGQVSSEGQLNNISLHDAHLIATHPAITVGTLAAVFDGQAENCFVDCNIFTDMPNPCGGMFGKTTGATVTACVADVSIDATKYGMQATGGLIGSATETHITDCNVSGTVSGLNNVGGLVGTSSATSAIILRCHSTADVSAYGMFCGGLVGTATGTITQCSATGDVYCQQIGAGGLIGDGNVQLSNCFARGAVVSARYYAGGLIGEALAGTTISNCYATGPVTGAGYVGGLAGGGLASATCCYSAGQVSRVGNDPPPVGGFVGEAPEQCSYIDCFWDVEASGQPTSQGGALGKTTAEMKALATFASWNIATPASYNGEIWYIVPGEDYPRLAWEGVPEPPPAVGPIDSPHLPVRFVVQTYSGQPLANITVTATPLESTGPWAWIYDFFGISGAVDINGTVLSGTTDTGGGIVFSMIQSVKYLVAITDPSRGIDTEITVYPQEDEVLISVWPQEAPGPANDFTLYAEDGSGGTRVGVRYTTEDLTRITFTVMTEAGEIVAQKISTAQANDLSHIIDGKPGETYLYGYIAEHKTAGELKKDQFIRFAGEARPWVDFAPWIPLYAYHWASIFILVGFAMTFVRGENRGALLTIPIIAGILWLIGWFQIPWLIVAIAIVIGALVYTRMSEGDLGL